MGFWKGVLNVVGSIPVVGHVTAGVQFIAGEKEGAKKSFAASTGNLVSTAGAVGGFLVGGPPGAIAGGAAGSALGGQLENKLNGKDFDFSASKLLTDAAIGGVGGLAGGGGAGGLLKSAGSMIGREVGKTTVKFAAGTGLKTLLTSTATQLARFVPILSHVLNGPFSNSTPIALLVMKSRAPGRALGTVKRKILRRPRRGSVSSPATRTPRPARSKPTASNW